MKFNPYIHRRRSIRLKDYDYAHEGAYFITIATKNSTRIFGDVKNDKVILNESGKIAEQCRLEIQNHFPNVYLDEYIIMPNHIHGIIFIINNHAGANKHSPNNINHKTKNIAVGAYDYTPLLINPMFRLTQIHLLGR